MLDHLCIETLLNMLTVCTDGGCQCFGKNVFYDQILRG